MKEILCFAKYAVKRRQAFNQRFHNGKRLALLGLYFFLFITFLTLDTF